MKNDFDARNIRRAVVRGTNWVGDAAMTVPALRELRRVLPEAHITLCTKPQLAGLFQDADFVDEILFYEKRNSRAQTVLHQARTWRSREFELAILLNNAFESALVAKLAGVRHRIGYRTDARSFLLTAPLAIPEWKNERHEVFYYLNIVAELENLLRGASEVFKRAPNNEINVSRERKQIALENLKASGVDVSRKIVALCPGSTNSRAKRWHVESYAALADLISEKLNASVILVGAPYELLVSEEVFERAQSKPILLAGKTNLAEAAAILSVVDLLVTNDTGPAHIAPAVKTPTIVIFGSTIPATTRPFSSLAEIIRKPPECAPCMLRDCPIDHRCMTAITPAEVFETVKQKLAANVRR